MSDIQELANKAFKKAAEIVTEKTQPIENKIHEATGNKSKKLGDAISIPLTGKKWREGVANDLRTGIATVIGNEIGGKAGATLLGNAAESISNRPTEDRK